MTEFEYRFIKQILTCCVHVQQQWNIGLHVYVCSHVSGLTRLCLRPNVGLDVSRLLKEINIIQRVYSRQSTTTVE